MADGILTVGADVTPMMRDVRSAYAKLQSEISSKGFSIDTSRAARSLSSLTQQSERLSRSLTRSSEVFLSIASVSSAIFGTQRAFAALVQSVRETEMAFAQIQSILQTSSANLKTFQGELFRVANQTGTAFSQAAEVANEFARQGLSLNDTLKATKDALTLVRLSGLSTADAVSSLTAQVNTFKNEALTTTQAVERLATVAAAYAVSENDLALALQRTGAAASSAGAEYNQLISIVTALQQRTARGGSVIGNGLKSIFTRVQNTETLDLLEELGVQVRNLEGDTLPVLQILDGLAGKFQNLSSAQKASVTEATAGIYQVNTLQALLADLSSSYSLYEDALVKASSSTDQASIRNERLNETLDALFVRTGNNLQEFNSTLGELTIEPVVRKVLDGLNTIFEKFEAFEDSDFGQGILKGIGDVLSGPALVLVSTTVLKIGNALRKGFQTALKDLGALSGFGNKYKITQEQVTAVLKSQDEAHKRIIASARTEQQQAEAILRVARMISAEYKAASSYFNLTTANVNRVAQGRPVKARAAGFLPVASAVSDELKMIEKGVGGASPSAKPVVIKDFNSGKGRETVVANTDEVIVKNFNGSGASAILTRDMVRELGGISALSAFGKVSKVTSAARGLVGEKNKFLKFSPENALVATNLQEFGKSLAEAEKALKKQIKALQGVTREQNPRKVAKAQKEMIRVNAELSRGSLAPRSIFTAEREANLLARKSQLNDIIKGVPTELRKAEKALSDTIYKKGVVKEATKAQEKQRKLEAKQKEREVQSIRASLGVTDVKRNAGKNLPKAIAEVNAKRAINNQARAARDAQLKAAEDDYQRYADSQRKKLTRASYAERFERENPSLVKGGAAKGGPKTYDQIRATVEAKELERALTAKARRDLGLDKPASFSEKVDAEQKRRADIAEAKRVRDAADQRESRSSFLAARAAAGRSLNSPSDPAYQAAVAAKIAERNQRNQDRTARKAAEAAKLARSTAFNARLEKLSTPLLFASLGLPIATQSLKDGKGGTRDQSIDTVTSALSVGGNILAAFPNKGGLALGGAAALTTLVGGGLDIFGQRGDKADVINKNAEELANKNNDLVNSIRAYIAAQGQLEDAISSGASIESVTSLSKAVSDALFSITDSSAIADLKKAFDGKDKYNDAQAVIDRLSKPVENQVAQKEFAKLIAAADEDSRSKGDSLLRLLGGRTQNLSTEILSNPAEFVTPLLKTITNENLGNAAKAASAFLSGDNTDLFGALGLEEVGQVIETFKNDLGDSIDVVKAKLATDILERAEISRRLEAERNLTNAVILSKKSLDTFADASIIASDILASRANRSFKSRVSKVTNRATSGINGVADLFTEFGINRATSINDAAQSTRDLRLGTLKDIVSDQLQGRLSQSQSKQLVDSLGLVRKSFGSDGLGFGDVVNVLEQSQDKDAFLNGEFMKQAETIGADLKDTLENLKDKLSSDLEKLRKSNLSQLFGGLGAVNSKGTLFKSAESLSDVRFRINEFTNRKLRPRTKEERQTFATERFALGTQGTEAFIENFNERLSSGVLTSKVNEEGAKILNELTGKGVISKDDKSNAITQLKGILGPQYQSIVKAQRSFLINQGGQSFNKTFQSFLGNVPREVSSKESFKKQAKLIQEQLDRGVPINQISLGGLQSTLGRNKQAAGAFGILSGRQKDIVSDLKDVSKAAEAAVESQLGIDELIKAIDALSLSNGQQDSLASISANTELANTFLQGINDKVSVFSTKFEQSFAGAQLRQAESDLAKLNSFDADENILLAKITAARRNYESAESELKNSSKQYYDPRTGKAETVSTLNPEQIAKLQKQIEASKAEKARYESELDKVGSLKRPYSREGLTEEINRLTQRIINLEAVGVRQPETLYNGLPKTTAQLRGDQPTVVNKPVPVEVKQTPQENQSLDVSVAPISINVDITGAPTELKVIIEQQIAEMQRQLGENIQRSIDAFARHNKLAPVVK